MPNSSRLTKVIAMRLPVAVYAILERRVNGKRSKHKRISDYLKVRIIYDVLRSHHKRNI